jgi:hypothetical protein
MADEWRVIDEFLNYEVSELGEIRNVFFGNVLSSRPNQRGALMLGLLLDGRQHMRAVNLLVVRAFLPLPLNSHYNTIIHLDGNRMNCRADNLMWRPLWFARAYHQQFESRNYDGWKVQIELTNTGEIFNNPREAAMVYGLLETDIRVDLMMQKGVYPGNLLFRYVRD